MIDSATIPEIHGATVYGINDAKIGSVGTVYIDPADGHATWATIKTGLFGTHESFVPLEAARWDNGYLHVDYDKDLIKDAPRVDVDQTMSAEEEDSLYRYYGLPTLAENAGTGYHQDVDITLDTTPDVDTTRAVATEGYDTSGPTTDTAMTRSEQQLHVGTEKVETGRARLHKYIVTEQQTVTVPVSHDELRVIREPITDTTTGDALTGLELSEEEHEIILTEERIVAAKEIVPVERIALGTETVTENRQVTESVSREEIELLDDTDTVRKH